MIRGDDGIGIAKGIIPDYKLLITNYEYVSDYDAAGWKEGVRLAVYLAEQIQDRLTLPIPSHVKRALFDFVRQPG